MSSKVLLPGIAAIAVISAGAFALLGPESPKPSSAAVAAAAESGRVLPDYAASAAESDVIEGVVRERIEVGKYVYLRLERGSGLTWVAVSTDPATVGDRVRVRDAHLMTNFSSPKLNRTFDEIYFGVIDRAGASSPHAGASPHGPSELPPGHPPTGASPHAELPHPTPAPSAASVAIGKVAKAEGPNGRTVAEIHAQRAKLKGQRIRVRGVVVKSTSGVLDKTFVHVRDGSAKDESNGDLTITTSSAQVVGTQVLFEGTVVVDKDFGAGYTYSVLLEDAQAITN